MAKLKVSGMEGVEAMFGKLVEKSPEAANKAIRAGGGVVSRAVRANVSGLRTDERWGTAGSPKSGPLAVQKAGLLNSLGITPTAKNGDVYDVAVGFDGYNGLRTKRWSGGQPNAMVARSIERGTSFMRAQRFMKAAVAQSKAAALAKIEKVITEELGVK